MTMWAAILLTGAASYALRVLPLLAGRRLELSQRVQDAVQHAAIGAMTAIAVTGLVHVVRSGSLPAALGAVAGVAVAVLLARSGRSLLVVVLAGTAIFLAISAGAAWT